MFTDDSCSTVRTNRNRLHVDWNFGRPLNKDCMVTTFNSRYQKVSVWSRFSVRGCTPLVKTIPRLDQHTYRIIVNNHKFSFLYNIRRETESFLLEKDNCGLQWAKSSTMHISNEEVKHKNRPVRSPHLNCIGIV